jgi:hypothetical protein
MAQGVGLHGIGYFKNSLDIGTFKLFDREDVCASKIHSESLKLRVDMRQPRKDYREEMQAF